MAGVSNEIMVDGVTIQTISDYSMRTAGTLHMASKRIAGAIRHESWRCNTKYNVSNEVNKAAVASKRIAKYLDQLSAVLRQGLQEIDATEKVLRSQLGSATPSAASVIAAGVRHVVDKKGV